MRLWSLHPKYLDRQGLLACWRESLLAQKVLQGETIGYRQHPQLTRFRQSPDPLMTIAAYLAGLADEAGRRGYSFNKHKILSAIGEWKLPVTNGQMLFEWEHLKAKLAQREVARLARFQGINLPECHPLFEVTSGEVEFWEKQ